MELQLLSETLDTNTNQCGNWVDLSHDLIEKMSNDNIEPPYFFEIITQSNLKSYVSVREFTADKDTIKIPEWLCDNLSIFGNEIITLKYINNVPKGKYIKLRPESKDFFDIPEYESCLEHKLSYYSLLYIGQQIEIEIFDNIYTIIVDEIEPDWDTVDFELNNINKNVINIIDVDISVDIQNKFLFDELKEKQKIEEEKKNKEKEDKKIKEEIEKERKQKEEEEKNKPVCHLTNDEVRQARLKFYENNIKK